MNPVLKILLNARFKFFAISFAVFSILLIPVRTTSQPSVITSSYAAEPPASKTIYGLASYYAQMFEGRKTANGEIFRHSLMTAACNVLPLGTYVRVTNLKNGRVIIVKTNDRLHPKTRRIIDLTYTAAQKLGFIKAGLTRVKIEILGKNYRSSKKA